MADGVGDAAEWLALLLFALCWGCTLTGSCLLVSIAPTAASLLGASDTLAPFTCGTFLVRLMLSHTTTLASL